MTTTLRFNIELPADLDRFKLPAALDTRLQNLLDQQDASQSLSEQERREAEGLVNLAELLTLLRLRSERASARAFPARFATK